MCKSAKNSEEKSTNKKHQEKKETVKYLCEM